MHQQTVYFRAPDAKFLLPWRGYTPPRSSPSRSLRSLAVLLGGPLTRIFESPEKFRVTGLHTHAFRLFAMSDVAQCWTVVEHRIYIRSTSNPSFFWFYERSTTHKELQQTAEKKVTIHKNLSKTIDEAIHETVTVRSAWIWFWSCSKPKSHLGDSLRFSEAATFSWRTITNRTNYCDFHNECQIFVFCSWKIFINATGAAG